MLGALEGLAIPGRLHWNEEPKDELDPDYLLDPGRIECAVPIGITTSRQRVRLGH